MVGCFVFLFVCLFACLFVCLLLLVVVVVVAAAAAVVVVVAAAAVVVVVCRGGWQSNMQIYTIHGCCNMFGTISEEGWTSAKNSLHLTELFIRAGD